MSMNKPVSALSAGFLCALLLVGAAYASPLKAWGHWKKAQTVQMCPDCKLKFVCVQKDDYRIGAAIDVENASTGAGTVSVALQDREKKPVSTASVQITLTQPSYSHGGTPREATYVGNGRYVVHTKELLWSGCYNVLVEVRAVTGDVVRQEFSFFK